jgi:hypothetical protein
MDMWMMLAGWLANFGFIEHKGMGGSLVPPREGAEEFLLGIS